MKSEASNYPKYLKSESGITIIKINNPMEYVMIMNGKDRGHTKYSYEKVTAPPERVSQLDKDGSYKPATHQEFLEACKKLRDFNELLYERAVAVTPLARINYLNK